MMTTEHDEALVERVALAMLLERKNPTHMDLCDTCYVCVKLRYKARAAIYPPAPPKTRLEVARELLAKARLEHGCNPHPIMRGIFDETSDMQAVLAALALPQMED